jgi:hypothetical protein
VKFHHLGELSFVRDFGPSLHQHFTTIRPIWINKTSDRQKISFVFLSKPPICHSAKKNVQIPQIRNVKQNEAQSEPLWLNIRQLVNLKIFSPSTCGVAAAFPTKIGSGQAGNLRNQSFFPSRRQWGKLVSSEKTECQGSRRRAERRRKRQGTPRRERVRTIRNQPERVGVGRERPDPT